MAMVRPRVIASPARADWPERAVTRPILIGSCAIAGAESVEADQRTRVPNADERTGGSAERSTWSSRSGPT